MNLANNLATRLPTTADDFLRWAARQEGRYELSRGKITMMVGATQNQVRIAVAMATQLRVRLNPSEWLVASADYAVRVGGAIRYPDILVAPVTPNGAQLATDEPVLVVEVLSPSSAVLDTTTKLREYTALPSLWLYVVASQDEPTVWVWRRGADGAFPLDPEMIDGREAVLAVPELGVDLPLAEIYQGIGPS